MNIIKNQVFGTGAGDSQNGYHVEHIDKPGLNVFSAANMAGFLDVPQIKNEVNQNLQWMYDNGIYYSKVSYLCLKNLSQLKFLAFCGRNDGQSSVAVFFGSERRMASRIQ